MGRMLRALFSSILAFALGVMLIVHSVIGLRYLFFPQAPWFWIGVGFCLTSLLGAIVAYVRYKENI